MTCPRCKKDNLNDAKFCNSCGQPLSPGRCWSCNEPFSDSDNFCTHCGVSLKNNQRENLLSKRPSLYLLLSLFCIVGAIVATLLAIHNEVYESELFAYSLVTTCLSIAAIFLFKPTLFKEKKTIGLLLVGSGIFLFLHGLLCDYISYGQRYMDWSDIELNFWVGLVVALIGTIIFLSALDWSNIGNNRPKNSRKEGDANKKGEDTFYETGPIDKTSAQSDERLQWNTVIDGMSFRFAWLFSYVFIWIGILFNCSMFIYFRFLPLVVGLLDFIIILFQLIIALGLYRFKKSAYITLMVSALISLVVTILSVIGFMVMYEYSKTIGPVLGLFFQILSIYYFYKRRHVYNK